MGMPRQHNFKNKKVQMVRGSQVLYFFLNFLIVTHNKFIWEMREWNEQ